MSVRKEQALVEKETKPTNLAAAQPHTVKQNRRVSLSNHHWHLISLDALLNMSLPVVNVSVNYAEEKGARLHDALGLATDALSAEKIKDFLEKFQGQKDVTRGIEDMDLSDGNRDSNQRLGKYKAQLVRPKLNNY